MTGSGTLWVSQRGRSDPSLARRDLSSLSSKTSGAAAARLQSPRRPGPAAAPPPPRRLTAMAGPAAQR